MRTFASLVGKRVAIYEPDTRGHRLYYIRLLVSALVQKGASVEVVTRAGAPNEPEWNIHLGDLTGTPIRFLEGSVSLAALGQNSDVHGVELTIVPDGDRYLIDAALGRWKATGFVSLLSMRPDSQAGPGFRPWAWGFAKKLLILAADGRRRVQAAALKSPMALRRFPIRWVSDPITLSCSYEDVRSARCDLERDGDRYWVGVFGAVTPRKNLGLIAEALIDVPGASLVIVGSVDAASLNGARGPLERLEEAGRTVRFVTNAVKDVEFDALLASVDCVVAAHSNEGPSGVVGKAYAAGRPLVLAGARSLHADSQRIGGLAAWSELDAASLARNIRHFANQSPRNVSLSSDIGSFVDGLL